MPSSNHLIDLQSSRHLWDWGTGSNMIHSKDRRSGLSSTPARRIFRMVAGSALNFVLNKWIHMDLLIRI